MTYYYIIIPSDGSEELFAELCAPVREDRVCTLLGIEGSARRLTEEEAAAIKEIEAREAAKVCCKNCKHYVMGQCLAAECAVPGREMLEDATGCKSFIPKSN